MHDVPVSVAGLSFHYPDGHVALQGVNLEVGAGERVALVGANGSGKSTLLLQLNGLLMPQVGEVIVDDRRVEPEHLTAIRNFVGLVFQNPDDQLFMPTVWDDVTFGPMNQGLRGKALIERASLALHSVGLDPAEYGDRNAHNLSGGEKKRVAIAGVLAMQPQVLLLDEPTAQLDPRSRRQLIQLLDLLPLTQIIATHDLDLVLDLCDRTVVLNRGQIVYDGQTEVMMSNTPLLKQYALESPLSYSRPYCLLTDSP